MRVEQDGGVVTITNEDPPTLDDDLDTALDAERDAVRACQGTPDQAEGRRAFLEKRDPVFE